MSELVLGVVQMRCVADRDANLARAIEAVEDVASRGANLICLPELFRTEYFCRTTEFSRFALAETVPGPTSEALAAVARRLSVVILGSVFEKRSEAVFHNTSFAIDDDGTFLGKYRKTHIPEDPGYHEKFYFVPGDLGFPVFTTRRGSVGVPVCWDQWFPEVARAFALAGARILVYPTAIGWDPTFDARARERERSAWETMHRSHAIANGCFVVGVNRVGLEGSEESGTQFWGSSVVVDPFGEVLARASNSNAESLVVPIDLEESERTRIEWPFFRDRRIDLYKDALSRRASHD